MQTWFENIGRFLVVMLLQLLLINNLHFMGVVNPLIYVFFLLALPAEMPRKWQIVVGFLTGLVVDICCNSLGVHTFACTAVCYLRPLLMRTLVPEDDRLTGTVSAVRIGWGTWIKYMVLLVLIHHSLVFLLEAFSFHAFWLTLIQIAASSALTIVLLLGCELLKSR